MDKTLSFRRILQSKSFREQCRLVFANAPLFGVHHLLHVELSGGPGCNLCLLLRRPCLHYKGVAA